VAVLTVSRQFGAGGKTLSEMVSSKMGYHFIDVEMTRMIAEKAKVSSEWVKSIEKEAGGALMKFISGLVSRDYIERILDKDKGYIDERVYVDTLYKIIPKIADEGNVVILGRGSQYILRDYKDARHLLLIAKLEDRIQFMVDHYNLTHDVAKHTVLRYDKRRINLYKKFGREDYDQPNLYHIVLNSSKVPLEKACDLVCKLLK